MTDEYLVIGAEDETVLETLYSGTKEDCYIEFDVLMQDEDTKKNYILIAVVKNILVANLDYNVSKYPEEGEEVISSGAEVKAIAVGGRLPQGAGC